jgi:phage-related protein
MPKSLSIASVIEKNRLSSGTPWLICVDISVINPATGALVEKIYLVRDTEPVTFNGNNYIPASFDIQLNDVSGQLTTVNLVIKDYTGQIQAQMQLYQGGVGFAIALSVVNAGNLTQPPEVVQYFQVVGATSNAYAVTFSLGARNLLTQAFPNRIQTRDFCQWRYMGAQCGYTGSMTTCDLSLNGPSGCIAHGNQINFGAFPGINNQNVSYG